MPGIYIHIPFCKQACHYCNFYFSTARKHRVGFTDALLKEIALQRDFLWDGSAGRLTEYVDNQLPLVSGFDDDSQTHRSDADHHGLSRRLDSIYFGGGTPSLLPVEDLERIFAKLAEYYTFDADTEITLEANPDDLTRGKLQALRQTAINRLSIGIQSFHEADLRYMNRVHSPGQALQAIEWSQQAGFGNLTVDLIYGTPTLDDTQWRENLDRIVNMGIPHISAYALTVEKSTALEVMIRRKQAAPVDEEQTARQFEVMADILTGHGYDHYEISNFGKPGFHSRHNLSYWSGVPYLGLGPSAHSYLDGQRWWNVSNMAAYISTVERGEVPCDTEVLTPQQQFDEYIMTSLRTMWGCDLNFVEQRWGKERLTRLLEEGRGHLERGCLVLDDSKLKLTRAGMLFADKIASDLFWV